VLIAFPFYVLVIALVFVVGAGSAESTSPWPSSAGDLRTRRPGRDTGDGAAGLGHGGPQGGVPTGG